MSPVAKRGTVQEIPSSEFSVVLFKFFNADHGLNPKFTVQIPIETKNLICDRHQL